MSGLILIAGIGLLLRSEKGFCIGLVINHQFRAGFELFEQEFGLGLGC